MMPSIRTILLKKREGIELSAQEITWLVKNFTEEKIPEYQISAFLMAVYLKGMTEPETQALLRAMIHSGKWLDFSKIAQGPLVDKHSTGGVGDKTSFLIIALLISSGCYVPMIAGRGLGHTGGTLDKFEALPGLSTSLSASEMKRSMKKIHGFLGGQTLELAPADRKLYALRDVTGTVESLPLIVSSILSKKLASGANTFVFDVKFGDGAFMKEFEKAHELARSLVDSASVFGAHARAALTNMNTPTGDAAGNALEINECLDILEGKLRNDTLELSLELTAQLLSMVFPEHDLTTHRKSLEEHISSGRALEIFHRIAVHQGANLSDLERKSTGWLTDGVTDFRLIAKSDGILKKVHTHALGLFLVDLGAGRKTLNDKINPKVGVFGLPKPGQKFEKGDTLCTMRATDSQKSMLAQLAKIFEFQNDSRHKINETMTETPLIAEWIKPSHLSLHASLQKLSKPNVPRAEN